jgi:hypothetical protein
VATFPLSPGAILLGTCAVTSEIVAEMKAVECIEKESRLTRARTWFPSTMRRSPSLML